MARMAALELPKLSRFVWQQTLSIFVPGAVFGLELLGAIAPIRVGALFKANLNAVGVVASVLAAASVVYSVGVLLRGLGFWVLNRIRPLDPADPWEYVLRSAERQFPSGAVRQAIGSAGWPREPGPEADRGELVNGLFVYTKFWLRKNAPLNAVDDLEVEINVRAGLLLPIFFAWAPAARLVSGQAWSAQSRWVWAVAALLCSSLVAAITALRASRQQKREKFQSLQHFVASWMVQQGSTAASIDSRASSSTGSSSSG